MKPISLDFTFTGDLFADDWPDSGDDYGYITYTFENKHHKDSGGYLTAYMWKLLTYVSDDIQRKEKTTITSLDGDFGLRVIPLNETVDVTIYSGTNNIYTTKMTRDDFVHFCLEAANRFFTILLKINPELKKNERFQVLYSKKQKHRMSLFLKKNSLES